MIFLYRFDKHKTKNGIDFVLNEGIAEDMYPDLELLLRPLVRSVSEFLMSYKDYSKTDTIFSGRIRDTNELEVTFSEGLGKYVGDYEKSMIFQQAKLIAEVLAQVMDRRSKESSTTPIMAQQAKGTAKKRTKRMRTDRPLAATGKKNTQGAVHRLLTPLSMNRQFVEDFISADAPCFAMGVVEEAKRPLGCMALRTLEAIPAEVSSGGFNFGHSILGNSQFEVLHFIFEFYGFKKFNVLVNPNNPLVQSVLTMMIESGEYFFFALSPNNSATTFRSEIGQEALNGIEANIARIKGSQTSDSQYERAISDFLKNPEPPGALLDWVCRDNMGYLDLSGDTVALNPSKR